MLVNLKQILVRIYLCVKEGTYLWVRLYCLNSIHERIFTINLDLPNYRSIVCLKKWTFGFFNSIQITQATTSRFQVEKGDSKDKYNTFIKTTGLSKSSNTQGNGVNRSTRLNYKKFKYIHSNLWRRGRITGLNRLQVKFYSSECQTYNLEAELVKLYKIANKFPNKRLNINLYKFMYKKDLYIKAYNNLKSKKGNMTPAVEPDTLDGISLEFFDEVIKSMYDRSFRFKPMRRVFIQKKSGVERPLTIVNPRDKIILECIRIILELVYEPIFKQQSHSFRFNHSCHTCIEDFVDNSKASKWILNFDIVKCFDKIDKDILFNILNRRIADSNFLALISKSFNCGYGFPGKDVIYSIPGVPQGSIISPILSNIYLNELDKYIELKKKEFNIGLKPEINKEYIKLKSKKEWAQKIKSKELFNIRNQILKTNYYTDNDSYQRLYYVRYADDFLISLRCSYKKAVLIGYEIISFLKDKLKLEVTYNIKDIYKEEIKFLGFLITKGTNVYYRKVTMYNKIFTKRINTTIKIYAPLLDIISKLKSVGFLTKQIKSKPKTVWLHRDIREIIYLYNSVIYGFINYYKFVDNRGDLVNLLWQKLRGSCAKLLAMKYKMGTVKQVYRKFGNNIQVDNIKLYKPSYSKIKLKNNICINDDRLQLIPSLKATHKSLVRLLNSVCLKCNSNYKVEMHHIRELSDLSKERNEIQFYFSKARRKQIPLCRECHMDLHRKI